MFLIYRLNLNSPKNVWFCIFDNILRNIFWQVLEKDEKSGDALFALRAFTTGFTGTTYRNVGLKCDVSFAKSVVYFLTEL